MTILLNNWDYFHVYPHEECVQEKIASLIQFLCVKTFSSNIPENLETQAKESQQQKSQSQSPLKTYNNSNVNCSTKAYYYKCELWMFKLHILRFVVTKLIQFSKIYNDDKWNKKRNIVSMQSCTNILHRFMVTLNCVVEDYDTMEQIQPKLLKIISTSHILHYILNILMTNVQRLAKNNGGIVNDCGFAMGMEMTAVCIFVLVRLTRYSPFMTQVVKRGFLDTMCQLLCVSKQRNNKYVEMLVVNLLTNIVSTEQSLYNISVVSNHKKLMNFIFSYAVKPIVNTNSSISNSKNWNNNNQPNDECNDDGNEYILLKSLTGIVFGITANSKYVDYKWLVRFIRRGMIEKIHCEMSTQGDCNLYFYAIESLIFFLAGFLWLQYGNSNSDIDGRKNQSHKMELFVKYIQCHMRTFEKLYGFVSKQLERFGDRCCGFCVTADITNDDNDDRDGDTDSLLQCEKCKSVHYCCKNHQILDLPFHELVCSKIQTELQVSNHNNDCMGYRWQYTHTVHRFLTNIIGTHGDALFQAKARKLNDIGYDINSDHDKGQVKTMKQYTVQDVCDFIQTVCINQTAIGLDYDKMINGCSDKYTKWDKNCQNRICLSRKIMLLLDGILKSINYLIEIQMVEKFDSCMIELLLKNAIQYLTTQKWDNKNINWNGEINIRNDIQYGVFMVAAKYCLYCLKNVNQASYCYGQAAKRANSHVEFILAVRGLLYCRMYDFKCLNDISQIITNQAHRLEQFCQQENYKRSSRDNDSGQIHKYLCIKIMEVSYGWFWQSNAQRYLTLSPSSRLKLIIKRIQEDSDVTLTSNHKSNLNLISLFSDLDNIQTMQNILGLKQCNWINCRNKKQKLKLCKCKQVYYCSKICQKKDWSCNVYGVVPHRNKCENNLRN